jgi:hypothetical protein
MKILIKFPTRGRPEQFFETLDKYISLAKDRNGIDFLVTIDTNDDTMNNPEVLSKLDNLNVSYKIGLSANKVHAVNRDLNEYEKDWDILLLASDDMVPQNEGYDEVIRYVMCKNINNLDGVIWFNDGYQGAALNTLCIMGRNYYKRFNYIYHPSYKSVWCDNEFTQVSKILNKCIYLDQVLIRHQHPDFGFGSYDKIHVKNKIDDSDDQKNFHHRSMNNFFLRT